jgi:hypothetical protein
VKIELEKVKTYLGLQEETMLSLADLLEEKMQALGR